MVRRRRLWKRTRWAFVAASLAVMLLFALLWWRVERNEAILSSQSATLEVIPAMLPQDENGAPGYFAAASQFEAAEAVLGMPAADVLKSLKNATGCTCGMDSSEMDVAVPLRGEVREAVSRFMAAAEPAYETLKEAQTYPSAQFHDYTQRFTPNTDITGIFTPPRVAARYAIARARWAMVQDDPSTAGEWIVRALKSANALDNDVLLIVMMIKTSIGNRALETLQDFMCLYDSTELPDTLLEELARLRNRDTLKRFVDGEKAMITEGFRQMGAQQGFLFKMLVLSRSQEPMFTAMDQVASAIAADDVGVRNKMFDSLTARYGNASTNRTFLVNFADITVPGVVRGAESAEYLAAKSELAELALQLDWYRRDNGHYPKTLSALNSSPDEEPAADPFTGRPLGYQASPDGYALYSAGWNKRDDGGRMTRQAFDDVVWCVTRAPITE